MLILKTTTCSLTYRFRHKNVSLLISRLVNPLVTTLQKNERNQCQLISITIHHSSSSVNNHTSPTQELYLSKYRWLLSQERQPLLQVQDNQTWTHQPRQEWCKHRQSHHGATVKTNTNHLLTIITHNTRITTIVLQAKSVLATAPKVDQQHHHIDRMSSSTRWCVSLHLRSLRSSFKHQLVYKQLHNKDAPPNIRTLCQRQ